MPKNIFITQVTSGPDIGEKGERLAAEFLVAHRYRLIISNFKVPVGRNSKGVQVTGEIDIVALDENGVLCFVEVKTRSSEAFAGPLSAVDLRKQRQITRTSKVYKRVFGLWKMPARFDVVTVVIPPNGKTKIELVRGFWSADKFRKRRWHSDMYRQNY
jgi:putative endonuclease